MSPTRLSLRGIVNHICELGLKSGDIHGLLRYMTGRERRDKIVDGNAHGISGEESGWRGMERGRRMGRGERRDEEGLGL